MKKRAVVLSFTFYFLVFNATKVKAMHIGEGFLSPMWCILYFALSTPFFILGIRKIKKVTSKNKDIMMLLALVAAFSFVLSSMKLPSITGSSSHPTGTGFGAVLFGPFVMTVISTIVLVFQAVFLAHGGITTLGANVFSMGVMGTFAAYIIYKLVERKNRTVAIFSAAVLGDLVTYVTTALQLSLAFPAAKGGVFTAFIKFLSIFGITQIPLAIIEGIFTVMIFKFVEKHSASELRLLEEVKG